MVDFPSEYHQNGGFSLKPKGKLLVFQAESIFIHFQGDHSDGEATPKISALVILGYFFGDEQLPSYMGYLIFFMNHM